MKLIGMETNIYEEEQGSPYLTSAECLGTLKEAKYEEYQGRAEKQSSPSEFQNVLLEPELSLLSVSSLLDLSETSLQSGTVAACVCATDQSERKHLCEELLCSSGHKPREDPLHLPLHTEWPVLTEKKSDKKPERSHEIRVIKHTPSAITFSDFEFLSHEGNTKLRICEEGEAGDFSSEEEEADGRHDDAFTELPLYEAFFNCFHGRNVSQRKQAKQAKLTKDPHICHLENCDDHSEKELKDHDKEEKHMELETQPEKGSECPDSMSCLMKKLEQLNLDIEAALSASSSPSSTPSTKRHKQLCRVQVETGFYEDHQGKESWKNRRADYQELDCLPYPVSTGARPKTDAALLGKLIDPAYERRAADTHLITGNSILIRVLKLIKENMNQEEHPNIVLMVPVSGSMADWKQEYEKHGENNMTSQFGRIPQAEGPSPGHRWTRTITLPL